MLLKGFALLLSSPKVDAFVIKKTFPSLFNFQHAC